MIKKIVDFMRSGKGAILMSILWGIGLAALIFGICKDGRDCIIIKPYHYNDIVDPLNNFKYNNRCFKYKEVSSPCP